MTVAVALFTAVCLAGVILPRTQRRRAWDIVRGIRLRHALGNLPIIAVTVLAGGLLYLVPALQWSWWQQATGSSPANINLLGLEVVWLLPITAILLLAAIPLLADVEEELFRVGTRSWRGGLIRSLVFGLVHTIAGVPIAAAVALTIPGLWFTWHYLRGGLDEATRAHTAWNYTTIGVAIALATTRGGDLVTGQEQAVAALLTEPDVDFGLDTPALAELARAVIHVVSEPGEAQQNVAELLDRRGHMVANDPDTQLLAARLVETVYDHQDPT